MLVQGFRLRKNARIAVNSFRLFSFQPDKNVPSVDVKPVPSSETTQIPDEKRIRFNKTINISSMKVTDHISIAPGEKIVLCRCWRSKKFPLCDGAHGPYNKECGDNLGPAHITVKAV